MTWSETFQQWMPYVAPVIVAGLTAMGAALGRLILAQWRLARGRLSSDQQAQVETLASIAVKWVEQTTTPGTPSNEKLDRALDWLVKQAEARGLPVDHAFLEAAVEAAVLGLTNPEPPAA